MFKRLWLGARLKPILLAIYFRTPTFVSRRLYWAVSTFLIRDPRKPAFEKAFRSIASSGLIGDYLEFGVYHGWSFIMAFKLTQKYGLKDMRFFAFDSFEGLPSSEGTTFTQGQYRSSRELFVNMIKKAGVELARVEIVQGFYEYSLSDSVKREHQLRKAAVVYVDCDLYVSTKEVLTFLEDLVRPETIVCFDNWHSFEFYNQEGEMNQFGERKAFNEWPLSDRFEVFHDSIYGKSFFMRSEP